ncbi:MAG: hypothetical protein Q8P67_13600, partial [archaeon]|nr:hypothetical protein [archaeon]
MAAVEEEPELTFDLSKKKKKKRTPFSAPLEGGEESAAAAPRAKVSFSEDVVAGSDAAADSSVAESSAGLLADLNGSDRDYTYEELVDRIFATLENKNPDMLNRSRDQRVRVPPPNVMREGTRRTVWVNFADTAD